MGTVYERNYVKFFFPIGYGLLTLLCSGAGGLFILLDRFLHLGMLKASRHLLKERDGINVQHNQQREYDVVLKIRDKFSETFGRGFSDVEYDPKNGIIQVYGTGKSHIHP